MLGIAVLLLICLPFALALPLLLYLPMSRRVFRDGSNGALRVLRCLVAAGLLGFGLEDGTGGDMAFDLAPLGYLTVERLLGSPRGPVVGEWMGYGFLWIAAAWICFAIESRLAYRARDLDKREAMRRARQRQSTRTNAPAPLLARFLSPRVTLSLSAGLLGGVLQAALAVVSRSTLHAHELSFRFAADLFATTFKTILFVAGAVFVLSRLNEGSKVLPSYRDTTSLALANLCMVAAYLISLWIWASGSRADPALAICAMVLLAGGMLLVIGAVFRWMRDYGDPDYHEPALREEYGMPEPRPPGETG